MRKIIIAVFLSLILALTIIPFAAAASEGILAEDERCTSFYFGKDTTDDGTYIWGRTEDVSAAFGKRFNVEPAADYNIDPVRYNNYDGKWQDYQGDMFVSGSWNADFTTFTPAFRWPYPKRTLRYTYNADSLYNERNEPRPYAEVGMNEKGVSISATETLSSMKSGVTSIDPSISRGNGGITEVDVTSLVLMQAETARGACELLAKVIDTVGAGGREGLFLGDQKEVWYFQWFTGH
ncbi:MAG: C69 family dipeptidase, partial [Synergistaceae bacterium]|nr:C69 family dipeptidase [Synergistaceae bacterium]